MAYSLDKLEERRLALQAELDGAKSPADRNRLGQFATPTLLARDILQYAKQLTPLHERIRFLDPAIGTGAFYSALLQTCAEEQITEAVGFEIDSHYGQAAARLWAERGLVFKHRDFTREPASDRFNLIICNPPYVRHHHLSNDEKDRLRVLSRQASGTMLSGLAGLYCHFLAISHGWLAPGGVAGWLIPSEFMDVNYGRMLKRYLLEKVTLLHIHRFDPNDVQFADALVSSAIVWFRNSSPPKSYNVTFSFGGRINAPTVSRSVSTEVLADEMKWTRFPESGRREERNGTCLSEFFQIKRGMATGNNKFFILSAEQIATWRLPIEVFQPILPSPRYLPMDEILSDDEGIPEIDRRLFVLNTRLSETEIRRQYPNLFAYIEDGKSRDIHNRYLCRHRDPWYAQDNRPPAPIVCTYLGRGDAASGRPFRFILNQSRATVANVYLAMYPAPILRRAMRDDPLLIRRVWQQLNEICPQQLMGEGRVYGGGLHKLEPRELAVVDARAIAAMIPNYRPRLVPSQRSLFDASEL